MPGQVPREKWGADLEAGHLTCGLVSGPHQATCDPSPWTVHLGWVGPPGLSPKPVSTAPGERWELSWDRDQGASCS